MHDLSGVTGAETVPAQRRVEERIDSLAFDSLEASDRQRDSRPVVKTATVGNILRTATDWLVFKKKRKLTDSKLPQITQRNRTSVYT